MDPGAVLQGRLHSAEPWAVGTIAVSPSLQVFWPCWLPATCSPTRTCLAAVRPQSSANKGRECKHFSNAGIPTI